MPKRGCPLSPGQIQHFWLLAQGLHRPRNTGHGLWPPDQGPALLHMQMVTTAHRFQVLAKRPRVLSDKAPLWGTWPESPADGQRGADPVSRSISQRPRTPPHGRFQCLPKDGQDLDIGEVQPCPYPLNCLVSKRASHPQMGKLKPREVEQLSKGHILSCTFCLSTPFLCS